MWNIRRIFLKNRGFTLIEVILALAIASIVIIPIFSILNFCLMACNMGEQKDDLILNGRYASEFIKGEVRSADKIICIEKFNGLSDKYPSNIGFVIMIDEKNDKDYRYITYYHKDSKLIRIACTVNVKIYPNQSDFAGHNVIAEHVDNIEASKFHGDNSIICLDFEFKHGDEDLRVKKDIYIRCLTDY